MRTIVLLAVVAAALVVGVRVRLDSGSMILLAMTTYLGGVALLRPSWLRLRGAVDDDDSSRAGAAITAGIAAVVFGGLLVWRLVAVHDARGRCRRAVVTATAGHDRIAALRDTIRLPVWDAKTCGELLED